MLARVCGLAVIVFAACDAPASPSAAATASVPATEVAADSSRRTTAAAATASISATPAAAPTASRAAAASPSTSGSGGVAGQILWGSDPAPGVVIEIKQGGLFGSSARPIVASVTSDPQGRYRVTGLSPGEYTLFPNRTGTGFVGNTIPTVELASGVDTTAPAIYMTKSMGLLSPAQEASLPAPITFSWEQVPGTTRYELYITEIGSACIVPTSGLSPRPTYATSASATVTALTSGKHYTWTVKATQSDIDLAWYVGATRCFSVR